MILERNDWFYFCFTLFSQNKKITLCYCWYGFGGMNVGGFFTGRGGNNLTAESSPIKMSIFLKLPKWSRDILSNCLLGI